MNTEQYEDIPDKTYSELQGEEDSELNIVDAEDVREESEDMIRMILLYGSAIIFAEMVEKDIITLREYFVLTDYLEEQEASLSF